MNQIILILQNGYWKSIKNDYLFDSALMHKNLDLIFFLDKHDRYILQISLDEYGKT